jgi:hypothetical protein
MARDSRSRSLVSLPVLPLDMTDSTDFICSCGANYKVVRAKGNADHISHLVYCLECDKPLAATDGENVLKYFLVKSVRK